MNASELKISDIMSHDVVTVERNDTLAKADAVMKEKSIRHLPVLDSDGLLCGILTQRDIFRGKLLRSLGYGTHLENKMLSNHLVKEAMVEDVITVTPSTSVRDAAELIIENKVGCLPVVDGKRIEGIVTETNFMSLLTGE